MYFTREDILKIQRALLQIGTKDSEFKNAELPLLDLDIITVVLNGANRKVSVNNIIGLFNLLNRLDFINVSDTYDEHYITINEAIKLLPNRKRKEGLVITFLNTKGKWLIYLFKGTIDKFVDPSLWEDIFGLEYQIIDSIVPDEEDLTMSKPNESGNSLLSLKDREYDPEGFNNTAYKILRKRIVEIEGVKKNILLLEDLNEENCIYEIRYIFDLNEQKISIPSNCILKFNGGILDNGILEGNNTIINALPTKIFGENLDILGTFRNNENYAEWFNLDYGKTLKVFHGIDFINSYTIREKIIVDMGITPIYLNFRANSIVLAASDYINDYLFEIYNSYTTSGADRTINKVFGEGIIDLNDRCGLIKFLKSNNVVGNTNYPAEINITNLYVQKAGKSIDNTLVTYDSDCAPETAIVWSLGRVFITNCIFAVSRKVPDTQVPHCGLYIPHSDNKLNRVTVITPTVGIFGIGGNTFILDCHIWGAPNIAFYVTGDHTINNTYGDWAVCSFFVKASTLNVVNHFIIGSNSLYLPWYNGNNMCIVKLLKDKTALRGQLSYWQSSAGNAKIIVSENDPLVEISGNVNVLCSEIRNIKYLYDRRKSELNFEGPTTAYVKILGDFRRNIIKKIHVYSDAGVVYTLIPNRISSSHDLVLLATTGSYFDIPLSPSKCYLKYISPNNYLFLCIKGTYPRIMVEYSEFKYPIQIENLTEEEFEANRDDSSTELAIIWDKIPVNNSYNVSTCDMFYSSYMKTATVLISGKFYTPLPYTNTFTDTSKIAINCLAYHLSTGTLCRWTGTEWVGIDNVPVTCKKIGSTNARPSGVNDGFEYYDTTLKKKILWNGSEWVNVDGTSL